MRSLIGLVLLALHCEGFRAPRADPGPDCWYQYVCNSEGDNKVDEIKNQLKTPTECYEACVANADCMFFTFREFYTGLKVCELLSSCNNQGQCTGTTDCTSGPTDCSKVNPCPMLTYNPGNAVWSCDGSVDPYKNLVPSGYTCHSTCGGWKSVDGTETVKASSMCENGAWTPVDLKPASEAVVNTPDTDSPCQCLDFSLWYNPNEEPGADFYCTETDFSAASPENILNISPTEECVLMCDNYLVANIGCQNGAWTDADPELGVACYNAPPTLAGAPTTSAPTTTVVS